MELFYKVLIKFQIIKKPPNKIMIGISKHGNSPYQQISFLKKNEFQV